MKYDENSVSEDNRKIAQKFIKCVKDGFQLEKTPKYTIMGGNPNEEIAKLEYQKLVRDETDIKIFERKINRTKTYADSILRVIFEFDNTLKRLIYMKDFFFDLEFYVLRHIWCGVLDFPIKTPILFGKIYYGKHFMIGKYYFAPFKTLKYEMEDRLKKLEEKLPNLFPYEIIESDLFMELFRHFKYSDETKRDLKQMAQIIINYTEEESNVNQLNQYKGLLKKLKKLPHFGETIFFPYGPTKLLSKIDVSIICFPYKENTFVHIEQFGERYGLYPTKKHCKAIYSLINALKDFIV